MTDINKHLLPALASISRARAVDLEYLTGVTRLIETWENDRRTIDLNGRLAIVALLNQLDVERAALLTLLGVGGPNV